MYFFRTKNMQIIDLIKPLVLFEGFGAHLIKDDFYYCDYG